MDRALHGQVCKLPCSIPVPAKEQPRDRVPVPDTICSCLLRSWRSYWTQDFPCAGTGIRKASVILPWTSAHGAV